MKLTKKIKLYIEFSCGCALRTLTIFEKKYPKNKKPRNAIIVAWNFFLEQSEKNRKAAADDAAAAAAAAADAAAASIERKWQTEFLEEIDKLAGEKLI